MKRAYNKFLVISTIFLALGGAYLYFSNNLNSETIIPKAYGSSLVSSDGTSPVATTVSLSEKISSDISFLTTLASLNTIKIDTSLFSNKSFSILQNNAVKIDPVVPGRINPFAPITNGTNTNNVVLAPKATTDAPTGIANNSAVLNGTTNTLGGVTNAYFEYGPTAALGTVAVAVKPSLVGTFIKNVLGLTPKTNYFYKACVKVNAVALCGDVVSFNTN